jgi:hypothetical protein
MGTGDVDANEHVALFSVELAALWTTQGESGGKSTAPAYCITDTTFVQCTVEQPGMTQLPPWRLYVRPRLPH